MFSNPLTHISKKVTAIVVTIKATQHFGQRGRTHLCLFLLFRVEVVKSPPQTSKTNLPDTSNPDLQETVWLSLTILGDIPRLAP